MKVLERVNSDGKSYGLSRGCSDMKLYRREPKLLAILKRPRKGMVGHRVESKVTGGGKIGELRVRMTVHLDIVELCSCQEVN